MDEKSFERLIKILELTRSDNDSESLTSIRCANNLLDKNSLRWPDVLKARVQIKVVEKVVEKVVKVDKEPTDYESLFDYIEMHSTSEPLLSFTESLRDFYDAKGFLTEKQAQALYKNYERVRGY